MLVDVVLGAVQQKIGDRGRISTTNVGFYYMANAGGRLLGTVLSGLLYQLYGLEACLWASSAFVLAAGMISLRPTADSRGRHRVARLVS